MDGKIAWSAYLLVHGSVDGASAPSWVPASGRTTRRLSVGKVPDDSDQALNLHLTSSNFYNLLLQRTTRLRISTVPELILSAPHHHDLAFSPQKDL